MKIKESKITDKVLAYKTKNKKTDEEICVLLGITKPTYYTRLQKDNWKLSEVTHINILTYGN